MAHPRDDEYSPPVLARFFHSFPHLNISLHRVNATFQLKNEIYLESLGILGSIPAAWLILTLLVLLIYLLTRCCDRKPRPRHSILVLKWILAIFTLLCCAAIGVGLYGNDDVHNGIVQFVAATRNIDDIITAVHNQTTNIESTLSNEVQPILNELDDLFDQPIVNQTIRAVLLGAMSSLRGNTSTAIASIQEISRPLQGVDMKIVVNIVQMAEIIRWPVTMGVLSVLLVFCVVLLFGVARHSRCALITFSVFGLFAVIISWILASIYLATSVALGDLCTDPEGFLQREAGNGLRGDVLKYYVRCESMGSNPFSQRVLQGQRAVKAMTSSLAVVTRFSEGTYPISDLHPKMDILTKEVNKAGQLEASLATLLDCTNLHRQYLNATRSVCDLGLYGLTFMLVASAAAGFFFTVLVWVDSHTWIYIRKRRDYLQVDEQDPFLPPSAASQAIAARTLRSQGSYGSTGYFRSHPHNNHYTLPPSHPTDQPTLDGRSSREEKPQHGPHYVEPPSTLRGHEYGAPSVHGPNHGQYATLSKQCKTLESSDFY